MRHGVVLVSVVVVVVGLWVVVDSDVLVVVCEAVPLAQAESDNRAMAARHGRMSFFIGMIVIWIVTLQAMITPSVRSGLWGVTLP